MKLDAIALDDELAEHGRRDEYPLNPEIAVWTKRAWSPEFRAVFNRLMAEVVVDPETGEASEEDTDRAIFVATVTVCFVKWEGVEGSLVGGKYEPTDGALDYSTEVGLALFDPKITRRWEHFYAWWSSLAARQQNFQAQRVAASEKKPASSSSGNSPTDNTSDST
jgi:hypothetical protein